jgi:enamine deaminase RidA (YjgF/YER057c/UK114 family)
VRQLGTVPRVLDIVHLNPDGLPRNPAFSQAVSVAGHARTIYVGGQNAIGVDGAVIGDDAGTQTARALGNLELVLAEAGAGLDDVVSWTMQVVDGQPLGPAFAAFEQVWGTRQNPPAISVAFVSALANPSFLVEISAIAVVDAGA